MQNPKLFSQLFPRAMLMIVEGAVMLAFLVTACTPTPQTIGVIEPVDLFTSAALPDALG